MRRLHTRKELIFLLALMAFLLSSVITAFAETKGVSNGSSQDLSNNVPPYSLEQYCEDNGIDPDCSKTVAVDVELDNGEAGGGGSSSAGDAKVVEETAEKKTVSESTVTTETSESTIKTYTTETDQWTKRTVEGEHGTWTTIVYVDPQSGSYGIDVVQVDEIDLDSNGRVIKRGANGVIIEQEGGEYSLHDEGEPKDYSSYEASKNVGKLNSFIKDIQDITSKDTDTVIEHTRIKKDGKFIDAYTIEDEEGNERTIYKEDTTSYEYEDHLKYYQWWVRNADNTELYGDYEFHHLTNLDRGVGKTTVTFRDYGRHFFKVRPVYRRERWYIIEHHWSYTVVDEDGTSHTYSGTDYERRDLPDIDPIYGEYSPYGPVLVPLVCDECPGVYICIGDGCEDDCASQAGVVCDEDHSPTIQIEDRTELIK